MTAQHTVNPSSVESIHHNAVGTPRWGRPLQTSGMLRWSQYWERTWYLSADHVDRLQKPCYKVPVRSAREPWYNWAPTVVTHEKEDLHSFLLPWTLTRVGHCHPTIFSTGIGFPINSWRAASAKKLHGCKYVPNLWSTGHGLSFDTVALPWLQEKTKDPPPKLYPQKKKILIFLRVL